MQIVKNTTILYEPNYDKFCSFQELRTSFQGNHNSQLSTFNSQLKKLSTFNSQFSTEEILNYNDFPYFLNLHHIITPADVSPNGNAIHTPISP